MFIPPPVDRREYTPEAELPPRKRLCLTALTSRYEVGESSTAAPRPTRGHGIDYRFISTLDAETRRQRVEGVGYGIRDTWVNLREATEEIALDRQTRIFQSFESLIDDRQYYYETGYRTSLDIAGSPVIDAYDSLIAALTAQVSSLQGHLAMALGKIRALQARDQARADAPEGTSSSA
ncbi:hypothetical protein Tco_0692160 [Tanacetum coccineum]